MIPLALGSDEDRWLSILKLSDAPGRSCLQGMLLRMLLTRSCSCSSRDGREGVDGVEDDVELLHNEYPSSVSREEAAAARPCSGCSGDVDDVLEARLAPTSR